MAVVDAPPAASPPAPRARGFWGETWVRFRRRKLAMIALAYVLAMAVVALCAPMIAGTKPIVCRYKGQIYFPALAYFNARWEPAIFTHDRFRKVYPENLREKDPESWAIWPLVYQDPYRRIRTGEWPGQPENPTGIDGRPSRNNWFGTTQSGVDVFAQMVHGTTIALLVGFVSMGIATAIGVTIGALAGFFGSWIDVVLSRLIELVMCIPTLVLILALIAILEKPTIWHLMAVIGATGWTGIARLTRAEFIKLREAEYIVAAEAIGVGRGRIMFRYILPNALAPVLVPVTFGIASAILVESSLSFPGGAIFLAVLAYNLVGEGLQEATDPRLRGTDH
jgi:peptide/nickel transport system permease protein